jgi:hypothetical protein
MISATLAVTALAGAGLWYALPMLHATDRGQAAFTSPASSTDGSAKERRGAEAALAPAQEKGDKEGPKDEKPPDKVEKGEPFRFPGDAAGKLLGEVLPPAQRPGPFDDPTRPARRAAPPPRLSELEAELPLAPPFQPRPGPVVRREPRPRMVTPAPADEGFGEPQLPTRDEFGTLGRTREESEDASIPTPLPFLAEKPSSRAPLDDPSAEASARRILEGAMPERAAPPPYVRNAIPEPFEHRAPLPIPRPVETEDPVR